MVPTLGMENIVNMVVKLKMEFLGAEVELPHQHPLPDLYLLLHLYRLIPHLPHPPLLVILKTQTNVTLPVIQPVLFLQQVVISAHLHHQQIL